MGGLTRPPKRGDLIAPLRRLRNNRLVPTYSEARRQSASLQRAGLHVAGGFHAIGTSAGLLDEATGSRKRAENKPKEIHV